MLLLFEKTSRPKRTTASGLMKGLFYQKLNISVGGENSMNTKQYQRNM
jgi:hypothetical protein